LYYTTKSAKLKAKFAMARLYQGIVYELLANASSNHTEWFNVLRYNYAVPNPATPAQNSFWPGSFPTLHIGSSLSLLFDRAMPSGSRDVRKRALWKLLKPPCPCPHGRARGAPQKAQGLMEPRGTPGRQLWHPPPLPAAPTDASAPVPQPTGML